jgi:alkanesulfonate monooxygenase SsuD/methylene tetrahydromethanopterin reductase-like flavin-dependent oxidoreductase (luciferase family)
MRIGVGLPTTLPGADGRLIVEWARRADSGPFSSLGVLDRLVYDSYEPLTALAAAAAVTERVLLATTIVISPLHNTSKLAETSATLDALSGGRLVLGLAVGARAEDYEAAGVDHSTRGRRFAEQLSTLRGTWEEGRFSPQAARREGPTLLVGGSSDIGFARMARYADGYVHGGGPPRAFARAADKARAAWSDAGRPGRPQLWVAMMLRRKAPLTSGIITPLPGPSRRRSRRGCSQRRRPSRSSPGGMPRPAATNWCCSPPLPTYLSLTVSLR